MMQIQIWGDFECPYSYLQAVALSQLQKLHPEMEVIWRAPNLVPIPDQTPPSASYLNNLVMARGETLVGQEKLTLNTPSYLSNPWLAYESICFANHQGLSLRLALALYEAYFTHNSDIGNEQHLLAIATQVGMDAQALSEAFDAGVLTKQVMQDCQEFQTMGFQGTPAMLIGEKDFSPRSFSPVNGFTPLADLLKLSI